MPALEPKWKKMEKSVYNYGIEKRGGEGTD